MKTKTLFLVLSLALSFSAASSQVHAQEPARKEKNKTVAAASSNPVVGNGTPGQITKWIGADGSNNYTIGNSNITEDKFGKIGVGTKTPTSLFTVQGMIETTLGGYKFPDGTVQTTSTQAALFSVAHDATLQGDGTAAAPLGIVSPLEVRDLDNPAQQPFQLTRTCGVVDQSGGCAVNIGIPAGKRLVIEYVSMLATMPVGQVASFDIETSIGGVSVQHQLPLSPPAAGSFNTGPRASIGQQVRLYGDPGTVFSLGVTRSASVGEATFKFSVSGHLVNVVAPSS